jgi:N-terminal domain of anti-restriction factor ArdC
MWSLMSARVRVRTGFRDGLRAGRETSGARCGEPRCPEILRMPVSARTGQALVTKSPPESSLSWRPAAAAAKAPLAMPKNVATGRLYSGINVLIPGGSVIEHGFPVQGCYLPLGLGGNVRKGERGTTVVYADRFKAQISSPRLRSKLHSIPPLSLATPATWRPRCRSSAGVHGTRAKPRPLSIIANRPEVNVRRWR